MEDPFQIILDDYAGPEIQFHALRTRRAGRRSFVTFHLLTPGSWTVRQGHDVIEQIEVDLHEVLVNATVTIHLEPIEDPRYVRRRRPRPTRVDKQCTRFERKDTATPTVDVVSMDASGWSSCVASFAGCRCGLLRAAGPEPHTTVEDQPCLTLPLACTPAKCSGGSRLISTSSRSWRRCCRRTAASRRSAGSRRPSGRSVGSSRSRAARRGCRSAMRRGPAGSRCGC